MPCRRNSRTCSARETVRVLFGSLCRRTTLLRFRKRCAFKAAFLGGVGETQTKRDPIIAFSGEVGTGSPQKTRQRIESRAISDSKGTEIALAIKSLESIFRKSGIRFSVRKCDKRKKAGAHTVFKETECALERVPIRLNRKRALDSLVGRIFCGKPVTTFPENALGSPNNLVHPRDQDGKVFLDQRVIGASGGQQIVEHLGCGTEIAKAE